MLSLTESQVMAWIGTFLWTFMRIYMVVLTMPVLGSKSVPQSVRVLLCIMISWTLLPSIEPVFGVDLLSLESLLISVQQLLIGILMGFVLLLVSAGLTFAGQSIAFAMGLGFASMVDPQNGTNVPVLGQLFVIVSTLIFLQVNGHIIMLGLLSDSFQTLPIAIDGLTRNTYWELITWSSRIFVVGIMMALPAIAGIMLVNVGLGVMTKVAPQMNIFSVGFAVNIFFGLFLMIAILPSMMEAYTEFLAEGFGVVRELTSP